jgi:hypothetical protein
LNPSLKINKRNSIDVLRLWRIRVTRRAREIARIHDFDERQTRRQSLAFRRVFSQRIRTERSFVSSIAGAPAGATIFRRTLCEPVKPGV